MEFTSTWQRFNFDAAGNFPNRNELRIILRVDPALATFTGDVDVPTLDAAGNVTATRPGTLRATRWNVRAPSR